MWGSPFSTCHDFCCQRIPRGFGPLYKNRETSSPWAAISMPPMSVPNNRVLAAGPSLAVGPGFIPLSGPSSQVLAASR
jgi:hypothetical protein